MIDNEVHGFAIKNATDQKLISSIYAVAVFTIKELDFVSTESCWDK